MGTTDIPTVIKEVLMKPVISTRKLTAVLCFLLLLALMTLPLSAESMIPGDLMEGAGDLMEGAGDLIGDDASEMIDSLLHIGSIEDVNAMLSGYSPAMLLIVAVAALFFGMFGYRLFRIAIFVGGLGAGWILGTTVYGFIGPMLPETVPEYLPLIIDVVFAVVVAFIANKLINAGIFLASAAGTFFFLSGFEPFNLLVDAIYSDDADIKYMVARILVALIIGIIALKLTRPVMIITTATAGGMIAGIAAMVSFNMTENTMIETVVCLLLIVLCLTVQFRTTGKRRH